VIRGDEPFSAVAFGPFGQRIATGGVQGELALWDRTTGKPLWRIHTSTSTIQDVEFSHDGTQLATAGRDDHASNVWSAKDGAHLLSLRGHDGSVMRASFSPDGAVIATVSVDRTARLWDVSTGALLRVIHGPKYTAEFSPDGRSLLTTGSMEYAVLWDIDLDERSPEDIVAYVQERSPWRLVKGRLVLVESSAYP
jgi:WD40 repeat protein